MKLRQTLLLVLLAHVTFLRAQEVWGLAGGLAAEGTKDSSYSWQFGYRHTVRPKFGLSFTWTNEGHLPVHHRDGCSLQAWWCLAGWERPWSLAFGIGPYRYYDTQPDADGQHVNRHGIGALVTLQGVYASPREPWCGYAQVFTARIPGGENTLGVQAGVGYRFGPSALAGRSHPSRPGEVPLNVLGFFVGKTVLNTLASETSEAWLIEYRRALSAHWSLAFSYANEGDPTLMRRDGFTAQAWLGGSPGRGRLYLGVGVGPHFARIATLENGTADRDDFRRIGLRVSMGAGWRMDPEWIVRAAWHRTYSSYDRDTDLFMVGFGYLW